MRERYGERARKRESKGGTERERRRRERRERGDVRMKKRRRHVDEGELGETRRGSPPSENSEETRDRDEITQR